MRALLLVLPLLCSSPVLATEWEHCADSGGAASFDYLAGDDVGVLKISALTISAGEKVWASDAANGPGDPVEVGQAFEDDRSISIDAVDPKLAPVASLRLLKANEGSNVALGGTLTIAGQGAWVVSCDPP